MGLEEYLHLASVLRARGRTQESLSFLFDAVARHPGSSEARQALVDSLADVPLMAAGDKIRRILLSLCQDDKVSVQLLSVPLIALLENTEVFRWLQKSAACGEDPFANPDPGLGAFMRDPLLLAALPRMRILDPALEKVLAHLRRCILLRSSARRTAASMVPMDFLGALAAQCFFSGYAFLAAEDELERIASLREEVAVALRGSALDAASVEPSLLMIAMYGYLHVLSGSERLLMQPRTDWSPVFRSLI